jgi:hypothetical protein
VAQITTSAETGTLMPNNWRGALYPRKRTLAVIEQQDCSMLDWTSAANRALLVMPEAS